MVNAGSSKKGRTTACINVHSLVVHEEAIKELTKDKYTRSPPLSAQICYYRILYMHGRIDLRSFNIVGLSLFLLNMSLVYFVFNFLSRYNDISREQVL